MEPVELAINDAFAEMLLPRVCAGAERERVLASPFMACIDLRVDGGIDPSDRSLKVVRSRLMGRAAATLIRDDVVALRFAVASAGEDDRALVQDFAEQMTSFLGQPVENLLTARVGYSGRLVEDTPEQQ